jgi:NTP pyrophosphatase (non-canonical NTP hydrolase)
MLGLTSEVGEVADKVKKQIRDRNGEPFTDEQILAIQKELGDVLWYLARLNDHFGLSFQDTMKMNVEKLLGRKANNKIKGSGDNR